MALLSAKELAGELSVHPKTVMRLARQGFIPAERLGRRLRFDLTAVRAAMRKRMSAVLHAAVGQ